MNQMEYPCTCCQRTEDPQQCDNKECKKWRAWFLRSWEQMRQRYLPDADPCAACSCPAELCFHVCGQKQAWLRKKEEGR